MYQVFINDEEFLSTPHASLALWVCAKLLILLPFAGNVKVTQGERILERWVSIKPGVWMDKRK